MLLAVLLGANCGCGNAAKAGQHMSKDVTVFYIPFNYETYVPVTVESIEKDAICVLSISSSSHEAATIRRLVEAAGAGDFDDRFVRMKALGLLVGDLFIDKYGGIRSKDVEIRKLTPEGLQQLQTLLDGLATSQGCEI
ncbi:MAG: hypothetical protein ACREEP_10980 [Dongiaceae bacterium]